MNAGGGVFGAVVGVGLTFVIVPGFGARLHHRLSNTIRRSQSLAHARVAKVHANDLAIVGWTPTDMVARQLLAIVFGALTGAAVLSTIIGGIAVFAALVIGGCVGAGLPILSLRSRARRRRRSFLHAFSAYLDLVNVLLAGGAGIETALTAAAEAGDGWAFGTLRGCVTRARLSRRSPWNELRTLGLKWGLPEVVEVAGSMNLSGDHGARIRTSLAARADSMRSRQIAEIESLAQSATERMGVPMMMLFVGFMALLGYPALQTVVMNM